VVINHACKPFLDSVLPAADVSPQRLHAAQRYAVLGGGKRPASLARLLHGRGFGRSHRRVGCNPQRRWNSSIRTLWCTTICPRWTTTTYAAVSPRRIAPSTKRRPYSRATRSRSWRSLCWRATAPPRELRGPFEDEFRSRGCERHRGNGGRPSVGSLRRGPQTSSRRTRGHAPPQDRRPDSRERIAGRGMCRRS